MASFMGGLFNALGHAASGQNSGFNLLTGLLAQPKYSLTPRGPLEGLGSAMQYSQVATSRAQEAAQQSEYLRAKLLAAQQAQASQADFAKMIQTGAVKPPPGMSPEAFAAAYKSDPEGISKAWATSTFPQKYDPATEVEILKLRADIDRQRAEAEKAQREAIAGKTAEETKLAGAGSAIEAITAAGTRLSDRKSPLAPGSNVANILVPIVKGAQFIPGASEALEAATGATQADVVDRETLSKNAAALINTLTPMAQQSGGGGTVLGLSLAQQASANLDLQWETIRRILIQNTTQAIREADRKGITIPDEAALRKGLDELRAQDEAYTKAGGRINQAAVDKYTPTDEMVAEEAKKRGQTIGVGTGGQVSTQPAPVYTPLPEQGGDVEIPPTAAPTAPTAPAAPPAAVAPPPGVFGGAPSFSSMPSFSDLFGGAKAGLEAAPGVAADLYNRVVKTVPIPGVNAPVPSMPSLDAVVPPQTQAEILNTGQQAFADARPALRQAITAAREAGDKVAAVGNEVYALSGRKLGPVVNGVLEVSKTDKNLAREAVRKGYAKFVKIGTKYYRWTD